MNRAFFRRPISAIARWLAAGAAMILLLIPASSASGQDITVGVPQQSLNDSYSEFFGIGFRGASSDGRFFFNNGGPGALAPFGPAFSGGQMSGGGRLGGFGFGWNIFAGQGSDRSMIAQAPSLTVANGASGFFAHGAMRPFVTGIVPVVSARSFSPVTEKLSRMSAWPRPAPRQSEVEAAPRLPSSGTVDDPPLRLGR
jgi:hypothetical protein